MMSRTFTQILQKKGYTYTGGEVHGGQGWVAWRSRTGKLLETLFPVN